MKLVETLLITQNGIRNKPQITSMTDFVESGGFFTAESMLEFIGKPQPLIAISRFPDGLEYIHDGHHRALAMYLGGRREMHNDEYEVSEWSYDQYVNPNFALRFLTPFDPRKEIRLFDFGEYRKQIHQLLGAGKSEE